MTGAAAPSASKGRRAGPPLWFAALAALGLLAGVVIIALELLGIGVNVVVPGVNGRGPGRIRGRLHARSRGR
ncbi:MAG: hypothetical protein U0838_10185 [Chloroflexota bacterium]